VAITQISGPEMEFNGQRRGTKTVTELLRVVMEKRINTPIKEFLSKKAIYISL
jgi:hypothetical protein